MPSHVGGTRNASRHLKGERTTSGPVKQDTSSCWGRSCLGAGKRDGDLNPSPFNTARPADAAVKCQNRVITGCEL